MSETHDVREGTPSSSSSSLEDELTALESRITPTEPEFLVGGLRRVRCCENLSSFYSSSGSLKSSSETDTLMVDRGIRFLAECELCRKPLDHGRDIYMYRGDMPFCSEECRLKRIVMEDEIKTRGERRESARRRSWFFLFFVFTVLCRKLLRRNRQEEERRPGGEPPAVVESWIVPSDLRFLN